jgi:hypothetical protein
MLLLGGMLLSWMIASDGILLMFVLLVGPTLLASCLLLINTAFSSSTVRLTLEGFQYGFLQCSLNSDGGCLSLQYQELSLFLAATLLLTFSPFWHRLPVR